MVVLWTQGTSGTVQSCGQSNCYNVASGGGLLHYRLDTACAGPRTGLEKPLSSVALALARLDPARRNARPGGATVAQEQSFGGTG